MLSFFFLMKPRPPISTLFPYTTLFRSSHLVFATWLRWLPDALAWRLPAFVFGAVRSEEHTSELQSRENLVCRLLLEKKKINFLNISVNLIISINRISSQLDLYHHNLII